MGPCRTCGVDDRAPGGRCRPCRRAAQRRYHQTQKGRESARAMSAAYRINHPDRVRAAYKPKRLKREYGLTYEKYLLMVAEQDGRCAICRQPEGQVTKLGHPKMLAVDHDPVTGAIRGLLCGNCNVGLGLLRHDPHRLRAAAEYMKKSIDGQDTAREPKLGGTPVG